MQAMAAMQQQAMYANPQQAAMYQVRHRHHSSSHSSSCAACPAKPISALTPLPV